MLDMTKNILVAWLALLALAVLALAHVSAAGAVVCPAAAGAVIA